jgi:hypothetical protein
LKSPTRQGMLAGTPSARKDREIDHHNLREEEIWRIYSSIWIHPSGPGVRPRSRWSSSPLYFFFYSPNNHIRTWDDLVAPGTGADLARLAQPQPEKLRKKLRSFSPDRLERERVRRHPVREGRRPYLQKEVGGAVKTEPAVNWDKRRRAPADEARAET